MVKILDSTLREGEQTPNVKFTLEQKVEIARKLDEFGVDVIEAGMPVISEYDAQAVAAVATLGLNAEVLGHARAMRKDIDAVKYTGCTWVGIFCGINELSRQAKLRGRTKSEVYSMVGEAISYAKSLGLKVRYTPEDGTRTAINDLIEVAKLAKGAGADRFSIADTVGCGTRELVSKIVTAVKAEVDTELEYHGHNDYGQAVANSLTAFTAGVSVIDVTVNGLGERAGLTSSAEFCVALKDLYGVGSTNLAMIQELSALVKKYSGVNLDNLRPVVGGNAFIHTAKLHKDAVNKFRASYQALDPATVGRNKIPEQIDYATLIGVPFEKSAAELIGHRSGQGTRYVFMDSRVVPNATFYAIVRHVSNVQPEKSHVDMHRHNCDSAFLFMGEEDGMKGLQCTVNLAGSEFLVSSPASVFIPAGVDHSYRLINGSGYYINFVLSPNYNQSIVQLRK